MTREEAEGTAPWGSATWQTITLIVMAVLGAAVLVGLIVTLGIANRQRDRALELRAHSYDVMVLSRTLSGTIAKSEASLGRYVISGDRGLGALYFSQWRLAGMQINRLEQLTSRNVEQTDKVAQLRAAYNARGEELSLIALSTLYKKNSQALARYYKARQAPTLMAIERTLDRIIVGERALLEERNAVAMKTLEQSSRLAAILSVFGVLIVLGAIGLGWFTVYAVEDRAIARAEADAAFERASELAAAVAAATDELRIQEAKLRQVQKMDAVGQLTGGIAHDFNNMLAVVLGGLELARKKIVSDPRSARKHLEQATEGANRAATLTRRLLAFSREDSLRPETIPAATLISGMSDLLDRTLGDAITIESIDTAKGWRIRGDRVQIENAILNLAVNARDAMDERGLITISTDAVVLRQDEIDNCPAGEYVAIAVADEGCGMTPDVLERAYEPFFTTKAAGKGTGLGLSQIFAFARAQGGGIAIDTAPGVGTTVTLYIPRDAEGDAAASIVDSDPRTVRPTTNFQILVVEDDPRVLTATMGALEELGHVAIPCNDPTLAETMLIRHPDIDLIISDVLMPGRSGTEMIASVGPQFPHVAVLFVTGFAGEANNAEFGGHPVLRKPFTLAALERGVMETMARDRPAPPGQIAAE